MRAKELARERKKFNTINEQTVQQWQNSNCDCCPSQKKTGTFETEVDQGYSPAQLNPDSRNLVFYPNSPTYHQVAPFRLCHDKADNKDGHTYATNETNYAPPSHTATYSGCLSTQREEPLFFNENVVFSRANTE